VTSVSSVFSAISVFSVLSALNLFLLVFFSVLSLSFHLKFAISSFPSPHAKILLCPEARRVFRASNPALPLALKEHH